MIWLAVPALAAAAYQLLAALAAIRGIRRPGARGRGPGAGGRGPGVTKNQDFSPSPALFSPLIAEPNTDTAPTAPSPSPQPPAPDGDPISILKPVHGRDPRFYEAIRSHAEQDYPEFEILFGVADAADPALKDIARLRTEFPQIHIEAVLVSTAAPNAKVGSSPNWPAAPAIRCSW